MNGGEKKELTLREMLGLGVLMPAWANGLLAVFGLSLFGVELLSGRFEIGAIYFLVTGLSFTRQVFKELNLDKESAAWAMIGIGFAVSTIVFAVTQYPNVQW